MGDARPDNWLASVDHGLYTQHHAIGRNLVIQCGWLYEHAIDLDGVRRFHHNLGRGLLGRRIERSPLPFARAHWVVDRGPADIDIEKSPRPRSEVSDWYDERAQLPIDPEWGPGWHLGVLPLTDGSTAASLVLSHYLIDGLGLVLALVDGLMGNTHDLGYPPPRSRTRRRAIAEDARQTVRDTREVARVLGVAARQARRQRKETVKSPSPRPLARPDIDRDEPIVVPGVTVGVDLADWDARAKALGGTANTLGAAFAAKFGELIGRQHADGGVTLQLPVSERTEGDTRANAMGFARVTLDPTQVTKDLGDARSAIKHALEALRETPDDSLQVAWLAAFTPKRALKRMNDAMVADPDLPVFYSNLGDVGNVVNRLDGTDAEWCTARVTAQHERREWLERIGGLMTLQSLRIPSRFVVSINAYQPGAENTKPAMRELAARTLAEFDLVGEID